MARRGEEEPVVFDLVEDNGPDADAANAHGSPAGQRLRLPRLSLRTSVITGVVVSVMVLTVAAVDLVRDHRRAELMRTSSIGVASLADPPAENWTLPFDAPAPQDPGTYVDQRLVTMDGLLVLPPGSARNYSIDASAGLAEPAPVGFEDVVAIDPRTGEPAWRVALGESPLCGPTGYNAAVSTDALVCVHGPDDAREVLTIAPDGSTRSRAADLTDGEQIFPGPDGLSVRVARFGDAAEPVECSRIGHCMPSILTDGRDLRVTAEDAATGDERWTSTVEFAPVSVLNCQQVDPVGGELWVDPDRVTAYTGSETVTVDGCGVLATMSVSGVRLDLAGEADASSPGWVEELGSGRFAVQRDGSETVVVDAAGESLLTLHGRPRFDATSPDAPDDLWFVFRPNGEGFEAVREDGSVAWEDTRNPGLVLVGRHVVVVDRGSRVAGLDRDTGAQLWTWNGEDILGLLRYRALTDGETVALQYVPQDGSGDGQLVALDLDTGEQLWDVATTGTVVAVEGHIVELTSDGLTGLG